MTNMDWWLKLGLWEQASICLDDIWILELDGRIARVYTSFDHMHVGGIFFGTIIF